MHFLLGKGTIPLHQGLADSSPWCYGPYQGIVSGSAFLLSGNFRCVPCRQGLMACQGLGWSCCAVSLRVKAS